MGKAFMGLCNEQKRKTGFFVFLALVMLLLMPSQQTYAKSKAQIKSVSATKSVSVQRGSKKKVKLNIKYKKKGSIKVTASSSKKAVATASYKSGKVVITGKKAGGATITVKVKGKNTKKIKIKVTVKGATSQSTPTPTPTPAQTVEKVTSVTLSQTSLVMNPGESKALTATATPSSAADKSIVWSSQNTAVATVYNGTVTAAAAGSTVIRATNSASGKFAICSVTVRGVATVSNQQQLNSVIANIGNYYKIVITGGSINIPAGDYSGVALEIAGNADVTNAGRFSSVTLAGGNLTNTASNSITVTSAGVSLSLPAGGTSSVEVAIAGGTQGSGVSILNDGGLSSLKVSSGANVKLSGNVTTPVAVTVNADNVKLVTKEPVSLTANGKMEVHFLKDVDSATTIRVGTNGQQPGVYGFGGPYTVITANGQKTTIEPQESNEVDPVRITGKVVDLISPEKVISGAKVSLIPKKASATVVAKNTVTDANGIFTFADTAASEYTITFEADGYKSAKQYVVASEDTVLEDMALLSKSVTDGNDAAIFGTVSNASNAKPISGITIEIYEGKGMTGGTAVKTTTTDSDGTYSVSGLAGGQYTVYAVDKRNDGGMRFIDGYVDVSLSPGASANDKNLVLSSAIEGGVRFVLTWGNEQDGAPEDMDAHLYGISATEGKSHVYHGAKSYGFVNAAVVLDVDDMEYEGPETITILSPDPDTDYYYYVKKYSSGNMGRSKANVKVYSGSAMIGAFDVPVNGGEDTDWWKVCCYHGSSGQLEAFNTLSENGDEITGASDYKTDIEALITGVTSTKDPNLSSDVYGADFDTDTYTETMSGIQIESSYDWNELEKTLRYEGLTSADTYVIEKKIDREREKIGNLVVSRAGKRIATYELFYVCSDYDNREDIWDRLVDENGSFVAVEKVEINSVSGKYTVQAGGTLQMKAAITPVGATDQNVTWSVSDETYATISKTGLLKGVKEGKVTVYVETNDGARKASKEITVTGAGGNEDPDDTEEQDESEDLDDPEEQEGEYTIAIVSSTGSFKLKAPDEADNKDTLVLSAVVKKDGKDADNVNVTWSSSDKNVASVLSNGKVTGKAAGTVTITATVQVDGTVIGKKTQVITVLNESGTSEESQEETDLTEGVLTEDGIVNIPSFTLTTLDDDDLSSSDLTSGDKDGILILGPTGCENCAALLEGLGNSDLLNDANIYFTILPRTDDPDEEVDEYRSDYSDKIVYCYEGGNNALNKIASAVNRNSTGSHDTPIVVIIDPNGKIRYYNEGVSKATDLESAINDIEKMDNSSGDGGEEGDKEGGEEEGDEEDEGDVDYNGTYVLTITNDGEPLENTYEVYRYGEDLYNYDFYPALSVTKNGTVIEDIEYDDEYSVEWSISDPEVATFDEYGWLVVKKAGTIKITATLKTADGKTVLGKKTTNDITFTEENDDDEE